MLSLPMFLLDACPYLLLKLHNINNIGFYRTKMNAKQWLHCKYVSGAGADSDQQATFVQSRSPLNPHSAKCIAIKCIAMNPQYVQPRDDTELGAC
ncbi:hypothetical protein D1BOALGB6SA_10286 [Olavius sp. associated proteobacterium Delta 1]|nr:hypothetical protein D1BOALGB6SA_10286 [Olavius sp. associated proteobacterium Delta 1]